MPLITIVIELIVVGLLLWVVETYVPMADPIKTILRIVVIIVVVAWLLNVFGVLGYLGNMSTPRLH